VHLHIEDSGVGFDPVVVDHGGLGLLSMRERVGILKGKLAINASPGHGTRIGVSIPCHHRAKHRPPSHLSEDRLHSDRFGATAT
jgi:glucose-6-phosphate-specific signal transduction histidine kinase